MKSDYFCKQMVDDNQTFNCVIQVHSATGPEQEIIRRV